MAATQNLADLGRKPDQVDLITMHVVRSQRVTPHLMRVTFTGDDLEHFVPMGFDQWFRLFLPVSDDSLTKVPRKLSTLSYLRFLTVSKTDRPILRNYTVRAFRDGGDGAREMDVDFVLHGTAADGTAGPASAWAETCSPGDPVAILDEGIGFAPPPGLTDFRFVTDETGLPALAAILECLPPDATGEAIIEVPSPDDQQDLTTPAGIEVRWLPRADGQRPGTVALALVQGEPVPTTPFFGWTVGEQALPVGVRRHWVAAGVPKEHVMFCGYWRDKT